MIIEVDPKLGISQGEVAYLSHSGVYGLAGWEDEIFAFDSSGDVIAVDPTDGSWSVIAETGISWWGAGVVTVTGR